MRFSTLSANARKGWGTPDMFHTDIPDKQIPVGNDRLEKQILRCAQDDKALLDDRALFVVGSR